MATVKPEMSAVAQGTQVAVPDATAIQGQWGANREAESSLTNLRQDLSGEAILGIVEADAWDEKRRDLERVFRDMAHSVTHMPTSAAGTAGNVQVLQTVFFSAVAGASMFHVAWWLLSSF